MTAWQPSATLEACRQRAALYQRIREFFQHKQVLEVETPILGHFGVTDLHLDNFELPYYNDTLSLQTSPEYHMKRLLCAGFPSIYQISKAFRYEQSGSRHNPEFTLLEWYRLGFNDQQLMDEVDELLMLVLNRPKAIRQTYEETFQQMLGFSPLTVSLLEMSEQVSIHVPGFHHQLSTVDEGLDLLMGAVIEPQLGFEAPVFIYDYPKSQGALAVVEGPVAKRFEVYIDGIELANGFFELACAREQQVRFEADNQLRREQGKKDKAIDSFFLTALSKGGLPRCAGVALGLDRLLMIAGQHKHIKETVSFALDNA